MPPDGNGWNEWKQHVLAVLDELKSSNESMKDRIDSMHIEVLDRIAEINIEIAGLKVKSGVWGVIGGIIPVAILIITNFFFRR